MGTTSFWHWIIVIALFMLLFGGKGKLSDFMTDLAKGIKSFKKGMADDDSDKSDRRFINHKMNMSDDLINKEKKNDV